MITIANANALHLPLPDRSVQCVVTSPPYYGLRDYGTAKWEGGNAECDHAYDRSHNGRSSTLGGGKETQSKGSVYRDCVLCGAHRIDAQIGLEATPAAYVANIVAVMRECWRVLKDDGVLWLNLGDSYMSNGQSQNAPGGDVGQRGMRQGNATRPPKVNGLKPKDLVGIPWRVAFALQDDGWYLRQDIIWCLSGGTYVYARTQKGDMPMTIKDMARLDPSTVQLWNGEKWTRVLGMSKSHRRGDELEIVLRSGERISCTPTHKFSAETFRGDYRECGLYEAKDLRLGDMLQSVCLPQPFDCRDSEYIGPDAAWLAGLYIAEGSRSGDTIQIAGHAKESFRWNQVRKIAAAYGGSATRTTDGNNMEIRIYGKVINAIIDQFVSGRTAKDKCLAPVCWQYSNEFLRSLLEGYLSGDGHYDDVNRRWRLGFTRNYNLERDLRTLAARLGLKLTLNLASVKYEGKNRPTFRGEIRFMRNGHHNEKSPLEIVEIRKARCREVYDIGVEDEPHVFSLASGILTHNSKPNPMPESVTDRCTKAHEYIFLLTKQARYYYDAEAIKEPSNGWNRSKFTDERDILTKPNLGMSERVEHSGRNRRSVWTVATQPYSGSHFAVFPMALIEPMILAGTSQRGECPHCGKAWVRVVEKTESSWQDRKSAGHVGGIGGSIKLQKENGATYDYDNSAGGFGTPSKSTTTGWRPQCACPAHEPIPQTVLDPFAGSGTTGAVAVKHGRRAVLLDLNTKYIGLQFERTNGVQMTMPT